MNENHKTTRIYEMHVRVCVYTHENERLFGGRRDEQKENFPCLVEI